ncbi:hypothetical protein CPT_Moonbeam229 [Bacillus phage Moonbeam]|uniref:Uncharacterized protein n=1 Tax=Bacillus phage Moonbeam TaxID=1540091 RepID=A0A0A0RNN1_9CAUD|nr:hypothetical protein CPT_Moonbeam229 [Bacillus phage Moonbeam]AIW03627.1 hypothetical protein CPT_Moonbeam229 [Bacillus phage Moonbeam]
MKPINTMYTYITPFDTTEEVLQAAKNVSYEAAFIRCHDTLEAWRMNHDELVNIVRPAIYSNMYNGQELDDLERAYSILNHALDIKVPRAIEKF